ncbi:MAG: RidA family protein [Armatimonadota bacterium]
MTPHPEGDYLFLAGSAPYSSGVRAAPGFEIVHATLAQALPWRDGFERIDTLLREAARPRAALCGVELRSPAPFTREGFLQFNAGYRALLSEWGLLVGDQNPVARTNVAPAWNPPSEPVLHAFSYTVPAETGPGGETFVVAGGGDMRGGPLLEAAVIREGETSEEALREKAAYVLRAMEKRLTGLGRDWSYVTMVDVYTVQPMDAVLGPELLDRIGPATRHGLRWYHTRPPIEGLAFEMDLRGVRVELVV